MKIVIIGGGKLGYYLARNMIDMDYIVKVIEKNKSKCIKIANDLDAEVICGDGTEIEVLANANVGRADCFIAVTGRDQDNLVSCQLAKKKFMVHQVIARANNPRNLEALRKLGIDNAVSSTEIITKLIEQEIESVGVHLLASLKGKASICTITVPKHSKVVGMSLKDINFPKSSLIVSLLRNDDIIIPQGDTTICRGDEVIAVCKTDSQKDFIKIFNQMH